MRVVLSFVCLVFALMSGAATASPPYETTLAPPRAFADLKPGTAVDAAALAKFRADTTYSDAVGRKRFVRDAGDGASYYVLVANDVVARIGVEAPAAGLEARLAKLWGAATRSRSLAGEELVSWSDAVHRVDMACRDARCRLAFHALLAADFFGTSVAPPGPLSQLRPDMTVSDIAKIAPHHAAGGDVPAGPEDVRTLVDVKDGHLRSVLVGGVPPGTLQLLEQAWGKPEQTERGTVWTNADLGWRAVYEEALRTIQIAPYLPSNKLLGPGPGVAAFTHPLLGATTAQVAAAYPSYHADPKGGVIVLPPTEGGVSSTMVRLVLDPRTKRVSTVAVELPFTSRVGRDALLAAMTAKWGAPKHTTQQSRVVHAFPTNQVRIEAYESASALDLRLSL